MRRAGTAMSVMMTGPPWSHSSARMDLTAMRDQRLRPIERLWPALEERPRLRAGRQEIMARLGWEYDLAAPFLRTSGEKATRYPCPFPSGPGCPRRIILDSDGSIRAVCGCT